MAQSRLRLALLCLGLVLAAALPARAWLRHPDLPQLPAVVPLVAPLHALPGEAVPERVFGLLSTPPGWKPGDFAVVTIGGRFPATGRQHRLVEALLAEGAAVLELDLDAALGVSPENDGVPVADEAGVLAALFGALATLRAQENPGAVLAVGFGATAAATLRAAEPAEAAHRLEPGLLRFAAAIGLVDEDPTFAPGADTPAGEVWPLRVTMLCAALAWSLAEEPAPAQGLGTRCTAGLLGAGRAGAGERRLVRGPH